MESRTLGSGGLPVPWREEEASHSIQDTAPLLLSQEQPKKQKSVVGHPWPLTDEFPESRGLESHSTLAFVVVDGGGAPG